MQVSKLLRCLKECLYICLFPVQTPRCILGRFVLITGIGHCGTKWLATVLRRFQDNMVCYHERKTQLTPGNWYEALRHEFENGIDSYFDSCFESVADQLTKYEVVGDSGSWTIARVPEVDSKLHVDLVIHLVRNGIQNVHSVFYGNIHRSRSDWLYTHCLRWYGELTECPGEDWEAYTDWGYWCFSWSYQNLKMSSWMTERLGKDRVIVYRLEDLVEDVDTLMDLIQKVNPRVNLTVKKLRALQKRDVNRKIQGNRLPEALWAKWTDEQRKVFKRICGSTMEHYGYEIPPRP